MSSEQPLSLSNPTDLASEAMRFLQRQSPKWSCVTYRTLCRKFSLSARAGKRLLWTILKSKNKDIFGEEEEEEEKTTTTTLACVYAITSERGVELRVLNAGEEFDCNNDEELNEVAVYALVKRKEDGESVLEQLVSEEEAQTKAILDAEKEEEESGSWTLKCGTFEKSEIAKRLPRGKKFVSAATETTTTGSEQKKPVAGAAAKKPAAGGGPKSGNIASMFGGTGKKTVAKPKEPAKKKVTPKKKTPEKKKAKTPTPKKKAPMATNADAMIEDEEGDSDSDDLGGGGRRNRGGKRAFVDDEEEEEEEEPATTPVKKIKKSDEDSEPPSPEIIDKEPEEEETPRRRSTRSTPSKATPTPKSSSKKEKPLSKKAQKDIIKARKARMQKKVIEEMDDETGEELMRTVFVDPETGEECNEDGTLKAK
jgi:hypothetical protein